MSFIKNPDHPELPICQNLRTKASYVPDMRDEHYMEVHHPYNNYFCLKTLEAFGPDDGTVCPEDCTPDRVCFVPLLASQMARNREGNSGEDEIA